MKNTSRFLLLVSAAVALVAAHIYVTSLPSTVATPLAILDRLFDLGVALSVDLLALGIGSIALRRLGWQASSWLEHDVFAFGVGTGLLSLFLFLIGLAQLLYPPLIVGGLVVGLIVSRHAWLAILHKAREQLTHCEPLSRVEWLLLLLFSLLVLPMLLNALLPPTDVDGLISHLPAPELFLHSHSVVPVWNNVGPNYPIGADMLYLFGLAVASDISAQLIHFSFALALCVGVYAFAVKWMPRYAALLAMIVLMTSPVIGIEAGAPMLDLAWVLYEYMAVYAFFRWRESHAASGLVLAGVAMGFALSNKYLAVVGLGLVGILFLIESLRMPSRSWTVIAKNGLLFGLAAFVIAAPWYLKNWVWLGNPVYPFFFGYYGLDGHLRQPVGTWVGYGAGRDLKALVLFPWNVYRHWELFGSAINRGGPSYFFWFLPLYFLVRKRTITNWLLLICAVRFAAWWPYAQAIRYVLVIFPWLSVLSAFTVSSLLERVRRPSLQVALVMGTSIFALIGISLQWGFLLVLRDGALPFLVGQSSRDTFLADNLIDYTAVRFMNEKLPTNARILSMGDARVYYLEQSIICDDSHENWLNLSEIGRTPDGIAEQLHTLGITHIWISEDDFTYTRSFWGIAVEGDEQLFAEFRERYLAPLYADDYGYSVYAVRDSLLP